MKKEALIPKLIKLDGIESLPIGPEQAFVFSRVNGASTILEISQIVGFDTDQVYNILEEFRTLGFVDFVTLIKPNEKTAEPEVLKKLSGQERQELKKEDEDPQYNHVALETRIAIRLEFDRVNKEGLEPHQVLGVRLSADANEIKNRYYALVRRFHPDRYFQKLPKDYMDRIKYIFEALTSAFEILTAAKTVHKTVSNEQVMNYKAQRHYSLGYKEECLGNFKAAIQFYRMALSVDHHIDILSALERVEAALQKKG